MRTLEFTLPQATPSNNQLLRMHWRKRRAVKKQLAMEVAAALVRSGQRRPNEPLAQVYIEIERGSAGELDDDNLQGGTKLLIDVLEKPSQTNPHGLGLIENDNNQCVVKRRVTQAPAKRGQGYTRVLIAEVLEDNCEFSSRFGGAQ
ncbi:hypothetical protein [uncultured Microbulbifer sp.]|uniref:hypothetical protein n=1 Tax=uncultured Microbulbifer sp. TaxID=348147 RepID=UPI002629B15A|nr:hypothetical protein [uncultured Microbulbifer sp.]